MRCCEDCIHFRRRDDGLPVCMAVLVNAADRIERDRALKGTNALNRCAAFFGIARRHETHHDKAKP